MSEQKACRYCGESIRAEAVRCRYCRSRLSVFERHLWHRDSNDRRLAGVAAGLAHAFSLPVGYVRLAFVVAGFIQFIGVYVYIACWLAMPRRAGEQSLLERLIRELREAVERFASTSRSTHEHAAAGDGEKGGSVVVDGGDAER